MMHVWLLFPVPGRPGRWRVRTWLGGKYGPLWYRVPSQGPSRMTLDDLRRAKSMRIGPVAVVCRYYDVVPF